MNIYSKKYKKAHIPYLNQINNNIIKVIFFKI